MQSNSAKTGVPHLVGGDQSHQPSHRINRSIDQEPGRKRAQGKPLPPKHDTFAGTIYLGLRISVHKTAERIERPSSQNLTALTNLGALWQSISQPSEWWQLIGRKGLSQINAITELFTQIPAHSSEAAVNREIPLPVNFKKSPIAIDRVRPNLAFPLGNSETSGSNIGRIATAVSLPRFIHRSRPCNANGRDKPHDHGRKRRCPSQTSAICAFPAAHPANSHGTPGLYSIKS